jgi:large subunit ribosomal protein L21
MYAVIKSGGRQYKVSVGQRLEVERLPIEAGTQIEINDVLLISNADRALVGAPLVANATVLATVSEQKRGKKVIVFKYKPKKRYRHRRGHRQELSVLTIDDILTDGKSLITGEPPAAKAAPVSEDETAPEVSETSEETASQAEDESGRRIRRRRTSQAEETESSTEE